MKLFRRLFFNFLSYSEKKIGINISSHFKRIKKISISDRSQKKTSTKRKQINLILKFVDLIQKNWIFFLFSVNESIHKEYLKPINKCFIFFQKKKKNLKGFHFKKNLSALPVEIYDIQKKTKDIILVSSLKSNKSGSENLILLIQKKFSIFWSSFSKLENMKCHKRFSGIFHFQEICPLGKKSFIEFQKGAKLYAKKKLFLNKNLKFFRLKFYYEGCSFKNTFLFLVPKKGFFLYKAGNYYFIFLKKKTFFFIKISGARKTPLKNKIIYKNFSKNDYGRGKKYRLFVKVSCFLSKISTQLIFNSQKLFLLAIDCMTEDKKNLKKKKSNLRFFNLHFGEIFLWINSFDLLGLYSLLKSSETNDLITLKLLKLENKKGEVRDKNWAELLVCFSFRRFFYYLRQFHIVNFSEREKILHKTILKEKHGEVSVFLMKVYFNERFFEIFLFLIIFFNNLEKLSPHIYCLEFFKICETFLSWCTGFTVCSKRENILFLFFYKILKKMDLKMKLIFFLNKISY